MIWQAVIAHAPGEENFAEKIAQPVQEAGYGVSYRGTVLVGESFTEEASKALSAGGPVILCATINALGTGWVYLLVNSALARADKKRIFAVRMQEKAYLDHILGGTAVAEYWQDPEGSIQDLLKALRKHFPLEPEVAPSVHMETPPPAFLDRLTGISKFNSEALKSFRAELRPGTLQSISLDLGALEFLQRASLMRNGRLTLTGLLLFGDTPTDALPSAFARFIVYSGLMKTADGEPTDLRGSVIDQITGLHQQIASRVRSRQRVRTDSPRAEVIYEYPMRTIREIVANALVHRDYEDPQRWVHVRLFTDRVEVLSPGVWIGADLPGDGSSVRLGTLVSESVKRNLTLATVVAWARLVEGEGSGLPTSLEECREISAPEPTVAFVNGFVKVTIFPRGDWTAEESTAVWTTLLPALHQLPAPPADFVGREEELEQLRESLAQGGAGGVLGIQGLGGIGKTAFALKLAETLTPSYPDAQIFLNLRGTSQDSASPSEVMAHVIRSFRPEIRLPEAQPELAGLYRSLLHGKSTLLVLDDAADRQQVEPLIPPPGNLLLVTSRRRFTVPGLIVEDLGTLSPAEARALLLRLAPRVSDAADEIARLCGYLPLSLRLAGALLAERPDLTAQEYMRRLAEAPGEQVLGSILLSYDLLSPRSQAHLRGLAVFPSSFDRAAAAAVLSLDAESVDSALGELVRNSLLDWDARGRYRFHPLLRSFAESQLGDTEGNDARRRHAQHYLQVLGDTSVLYESGGEYLHRALELFDREWENFKAGFTWAAAKASESEESARLCMAYPNAGAYCLDLRLSPQERIRWLEPALVAARHLNDRKTEAVYLGAFGNACMDLGRYEEAASYYDEWLKVTREIGDRHAEGQALGNLGIIYDLLGDYSRAMARLEESLHIARESGDRRGEGVALANLGNVFTSTGDLESALSFYEQRLIIAREIGDRRGEGITLGNLGSAYAVLGQAQRAVDFYKQQLAITREIGDRRGEGIALGSLGEAFIALGETEQALTLYHQALAVLREIGDRPGETEIVWKLGRVYEEGEAAGSGRS